MKSKQKKKHVSQENPADDILTDPPRGEPPDDFETVINLLRSYLEMLSALDRDQIRELIDKGT